MSWIVSLLTRWGLKALIPYALPTLIGLLFTGTVGLAWFNGFDLGAAVLIVTILSLTASIFTFQSRFLQFVALALIVLAGYALGKHEEGKDVATRIDSAVKQAIEAVHADYKKAKAEDEARRAREAELARQRAETERKLWEEAYADMARQVEELHAAAERDTQANRPALGTDSVDRLNRLRGNELLSE